jgi:hypothetical protein
LGLHAVSLIWWNNWDPGKVERFLTSLAIMPKKRSEPRAVALAPQ